MSISDLSPWQTEKLPRDVLELLYQALLQETAQRCPYCGKPLMWEVRNWHMGSMQLVCKRWRLGFARLIMAQIHAPRFPLCHAPKDCYELWYCNYFYPSKARLPFVIVHHNNSEEDTDEDQILIMARANEYPP